MPEESARAQHPKATEYFLKAGFLVNFARLVEWPVASMDKSPEIVIGVLDPKPFGDSLKAISKKKIRGKKITMRICDSKTDYSRIHIVFLNSKNARLRKMIIDQIKNKPILTIGESPGFADNEGIINFYKIQNKLRFEINRTKADDAGLRISSRFLKLGRIITPGGS